MSFPIDLIRIIADGDYYSGEQLGKQLGVTRTAVWKQIKILQQYDIPIECVRGKGYRLVNPIDLLEKKNILKALDKNTVKNISVLDIENITDSTNAVLSRELKHDGFSGRVVLAEYQTAGRGRQNNYWVAPYGHSICLSIGWCFDPIPEILNLLSLATGVACVDALRKLGVRGIGLKWPNDIFYQNAKLGGILIDTRAENGGICYTIIGVGLNYIMPDTTRSQINQPVTDLKSIYKDITSRNLVIAKLLTELVAILKTPGLSDRKKIINTWREYDCMKGKKAELSTAGKKIKGKIAGIDDQGALLMSINGITEKFYSGEISLRLS